MWVDSKAIDIEVAQSAVDFFQVGLTQLMSFCVGADDSLPENILYKGLKLPLRAA